MSEIITIFAKVLVVNLVVQIVLAIMLSTTC